MLTFTVCCDIIIVKFVMNLGECNDKENQNYYYDRLCSGIAYNSPVHR